MKYIFNGRNFEVTEANKEIIKKKFKKFDKFFSNEAEAYFSMAVLNKKHLSDFEATIHNNGIIFRAEIKAEDMYVAIDKSVDIIERQIRRNKTRIEKKMHSGRKFEFEDFEEFKEEEEEEINIVKTKRFAIKPMSEEEAILQMNLLGHAFYMFRNSGTEEVNVVYKRKDGNYGLIEPEI